ncbi:hypothetical protein MKW98_023774, partial [Papaver atlanticum]
TTFGSYDRGRSSLAILFTYTSWFVKKYNKGRTDTRLHAVMMLCSFLLVVMYLLIFSRLCSTGK